MDKVNLLNRTDTKYVLKLSLLPKIIKELVNDYYILEVDNKRLFSYETLYFDTEDLKMFRAHHNGKLNRYKIRKREYVDSKLNYLEIKFKNNKGRTIKERIKGEELTSELSDRANQFILENSPFTADSLKGQVYTYFKRFTLINKKFNERITIDIDLVFKNTHKEASFPNISIIEIKQDRMTKESFLSDKLRENKIHPSSFSKYCFGTILTNDRVKKNNFKSKLLQIKKIENVG
ncbi:MAG: polyphosphate polymerase domain-containing protein [Bacteroidales bacterium]|nr:polyphosphate polymerase domain-containing protein [Bacteroidales bacterium]